MVASMGVVVFRMTTCREVGEGSFVGTTAFSVKEYLDVWLGGREILHENTREGYRSDLKPVYVKFGHLPLEALTASAMIKFAPPWLGFRRERET